MNKNLKLALILCLAPQLAAAQGLMNWVQANPSEVPSAGSGQPVFIEAAFKQVPNPQYQDPNESAPPNLTEDHLKAILEKMVKAELATLPKGSKPDKLTLKKEDVMRVIGNMAVIDRNYVDAIPAKVWDQAIEDMGKTAAEEYPKTKSWESTVNAMVKTAASKILDPFSVYWTKDEYKRFQDSMKNSFVGIGAILKEDGTIDVVVPGGPADKAGLKAGDKIVDVDGTPVKNSEEVVKRTLGKEGTTVSVTVQRGGQALPPFKIVRGQVTTKNVYSKLAAKDVGYIYLGQFSPDCDKEIIAAIGALKEKGAKKMIIDVRNNPGGTVDSVSSILSEFMKDKQTIVSFKNKGQVMYSNVTDGDGKFLSMPLVILVNGGSASASEILAGAIQDVRGPMIVGSRSYGKGTMQSVMPDREGRALKLTIGRWYTPRDRSIDAQHDPETKDKVKGTGGVVPDHLIVLTEEQEKAIMKQLYREVQGAAPEGAPVDDPVMQKALELLSK
ncbi:MAG: PDZ domain-containing protein [Elusimicrobia bacterium]|nr:PDZ domain-containing protein [Elusimicrobiota bacterium]